MKQIFWYFSSLSVIYQVTLAASLERISGTEQLNGIHHRSPRQVSYGYAQPYVVQQQQQPPYVVQQQQPPPYLQQLSQPPYQHQYAPVQANYLSNGTGYSGNQYVALPNRYLSNATGFTGPQNVSVQTGYRSNASYSGGYNPEPIYQDLVPAIGCRDGSDYGVRNYNYSGGLNYGIRNCSYSGGSDYGIRNYNYSGERNIYFDRMNFKRRESYNDSGRYRLYREGYDRNDRGIYGRYNLSFNLLGVDRDVDVILDRTDPDFYDGGGDRLGDRRLDRQRAGSYRRRGCPDGYGYQRRRNDSRASDDDRDGYGISDRYAGYYGNDTGYGRRDDYGEGRRNNFSLDDDSYDRDSDRISDRYRDDYDGNDRGYGPCERYRGDYERDEEGYGDSYAEDTRYR